MLMAAKCFNHRSVLVIKAALRSIKSAMPVP